MASGIRLMTVAEYERLPEPAAGRYELHHGELVLVTRPKKSHLDVQHRLLHWLQQSLDNRWTIRIELPYRPAPEHELWAADVAALSAARWSQSEDYLSGAPELAIEVLSPSNTAGEISDKESLCLSSGAVQFWVVDEKRRLIKVSVPGGSTTTYREQDSIPLDAFGGGSLAVASIFS